jgi:osmotically-inducible protein OsmY
LRIECYDHEGVVTLRGRVPSYYLKQVAQELVGRVPGVEVVSNHLEVAAVADLGTAVVYGPEGRYPRRTWSSIDP